MEMERISQIDLFCVPLFHVEQLLLKSSVLKLDCLHNEILKVAR
jgi:hypothetical protein